MANRRMWDEGRKKRLVFMWYKSNQRELDSTNAKSAHYSFIWWCKFGRLVVRCACHVSGSAHLRSFQKTTRPMDALIFNSHKFLLHFYIVFDLRRVFINFKNEKCAYKWKRIECPVSFVLYRQLKCLSNVWEKKEHEEKKIMEMHSHCNFINMRAHTHIYFDSMQFIAFSSRTKWNE